MTAVADKITITAIDPAGPSVTCLHGNGTSTFQSSSGWQFTKRPRRLSITEFFGPDPYTLVVPCMFGNPAGLGDNIEPRLEVLRGLARNMVGPRVEPAVLQIECPAIPYTWLQWVINDFKFNTEYRNNDGSRYYAQIDITFFEWQPSDLVPTKGGFTVAQKVVAAANASAASSGRTKVTSTPAVSSSGITVHPSGWGVTLPVSSAIWEVRKGDTLETIAKTTLGDASRWKDIAALNGNIRDPKSITVGQVLRLPAGAKVPTIPIPTVDSDPSMNPSTKQLL
jgi:LysM repeat protein